VERFARQWAGGPINPVIHHASLDKCCYSAADSIVVIGPCCFVVIIRYCFQYRGGTVFLAWTDVFLVTENDSLVFCRWDTMLV
jgi:hypothetical protein